MIVLLTSSLVACNKQQKIIFAGDSISYKGSEARNSESIARECREISEKLDTYLKDGWRVVSSSPKEKVVYLDSGTCKGTEYVLEK
jgi:hypothetical protein